MRYWCRSLNVFLSAAEELSVTERFDPSWYASLSFTLSDLPIFK